MFIIIFNGCATSLVYERKNGPHEVSIRSSGTFNQIYYTVIKHDNNKTWNVEKILCIPVIIDSAKKYLIIRNVLYMDINSANNDTDKYKSALKNYVDLKSVEVIKQNSKFRDLKSGFNIYFTYNPRPNVSNDLKYLRPNKMFVQGEMIPDGIIRNNYLVTTNGSIDQHGSHYSYLVYPPVTLKSTIEDEFDYRSYEHLLPDDNHTYTLNLMNSDAVYVHSAFFRYGITPFSVAVDVATSPLQLLFFWGLNNSSIAN